MTAGADSVRSIVRALIGALCAGALILIAMILAGSELDETSGRALGTAVAVAFFSLTALAGGALRERRGAAALFGYLVAAVSLAALAAVCVEIWELGADNDWETAGALLVLTLGGANASLLLRSARAEDDRAVRLVRAGVLATIAVLAVAAAGQIYAGEPELGPRVYGVIAVLYLLGTGLLPLLRRAGGGPRTHAPRPAAELLREHGFVLVERPPPRSGAHGVGQVHRLRRPDGEMVELIVYDEPDPGGHSY